LDYLCDVLALTKKDQKFDTTLSTLLVDGSQGAPNDLVEVGDKESHGNLQKWVDLESCNSLHLKIRQGKKNQHGQTPEEEP
jgi:hypothetical protein